MMRRLQVLAAAILLAVPFAAGQACLTAARADSWGLLPPPKARPLLPLSVDEFLARNGGLTRLKLKMQDATVDEIAEEVRRQTGLNIVKGQDSVASQGRGGYRPDSARRTKTPGSAPAKPAKPLRFSVEAGGEMFWEAVAPWARGGGLGVYLSSLDPVQWSLGVDQSGTQLRDRYVAAGPCHIELSQVKLSRVSTRVLAFETNNSYSDNRLTLSGALWTDPKFFPLITAAIVEVQSVSDGTGRELVQDNFGKATGTTFTSEWGHEWGEVMRLSTAQHQVMSVWMQAPDPAAKYLQLKGTLRLAVTTRREPWEIDLAKTPTAARTFAGEEGEVQASFKGLQPEGEGWIARFEFRRRFEAPRRLFRPQNPMPLGQSASLGDEAGVTSELRFFSSQGKLLARAATGSSEEAGGVSTLKIEASYGLKPRDHRGGFGGFGGFDPTPPKQDPPARITLNVPLEWHEVQIPFEFKDIPLP